MNKKPNTKTIKTALAEMKYKEKQGSFGQNMSVSNWLRLRSRSKPQYPKS